MFPGQGSQFPGMGDALFPRYPEKLKMAQSTLDYSIAELCLHEDDKLHQTLYTQPALFVVNALAYEDRRDEFQSDYHLGHSLGEYNALHASGCFDFETGLRLVKKRAELMDRTEGGGMAAVVGLTEKKIRDVLNREGNAVDIANYNSPTQYIVSGEKTSIEKMTDKLKMAGAKRIILLQVSGAFHSRYMAPLEEEFRAFLDNFEFDSPSVPVIANATVSLYTSDNIKENLIRQLSNPVRWIESIRKILGKKEECEFHEIGPGQVLTGLVRRIQEDRTPVERIE